MLHPNGIILPLRESGSYFITAFLISWSSPHPISNSQLRALLHFHPCPIYLVVFKGVYFFRMGHLILRGASRLDAFSVYPFRTWLPGCSLGSLTGTPAVRPSPVSYTHLYFFVLTAHIFPLIFRICPHGFSFILC